MNIKVIAVGIYIAFIYWLSLHVSFLDTLFFPALGAFGFLFAARSFHLAEYCKITLGAVVSSLAGTLLYLIYPGTVTLFINVLFAIWLIKRMKWNAPPIVAVAIIPFFSHSPYHVLVPVSVLVSLAGLTALLYAAELIAARWPKTAAAKREQPDMAG
ncbi:HPP family protein [Paenibacillus protaetiae]|uniref:HPP family protein n=1 Tax=Paenibacillus protaetiae TaxID=2509456 RepID=A0A4P6EZ78_9BACL|nr:HPP family protein [Paenibacillus protaetiae]QAY67583.1 hypothetical protein ET464_15525 [Paenibacillus protaetiae]